MNRIEIWNPRWHDRTVLIAKYKVKDLNDIVFTKGTLKGRSYQMTGADIVKHPLETNGKITCYAVPLRNVMGDDYETI